MKVVIPVGAFHVGGGPRVLAAVANALTKHGHDVEVVVPDQAPMEYDLLCRVTRVPALEKQYIPYGDIVLPNFYTTFPAAFEAWPAQCVRLSLGFEPLWVPDPAQAIWTYAQGVPTISISHWLDNQIYGQVGQRGSVVNLGIDRKVFHAKHRRVRHTRKIILYIARDPNAGYELKGYHDFLKAMKIVQRRYRNKFIVHMVCPERILPLPGIPHRCFRPKTDHEMARLYRRADVFVSTSWFEGFALPPLEAMSCGTPVVTTNSGGVLDFCTHKHTAYITPPKNPQRLAHGIKKVLTDRSFARKLRRNGREAARQFSAHRFERRIVRALESIYEARISATGVAGP